MNKKKDASLRPPRKARPTHALLEAQEEQDEADQKKEESLRKRNLQNLKKAAEQRVIETVVPQLPLYHVIYTNVRSVADWEGM